MDNVSKLVPIINKISEYQHPGKKALQKMIYLIEKKGVNLGFDFSIHYYGPYSSNLDYAIHSLQMQGLIDIVPDGLSQRIHTTELCDTLEDIDLPFEDINKVENVLDVFASMTAFDLEVITTTDYVARELCKSSNICDKNNIVDGVRRIKGEKFSIEKIHQAISTLNENGYSWN